MASLSLPTINPLTGKPFRKQKADEPDDAPEIVATPPSIFDEPERQAAARAERDRRDRAADRRLREEYEKWAFNMDAHPLRRVRLQHSRGPLSVDEAAALTRVSARTISRIELENHQPNDSIWIALALGLGVRRDQLDVSYVRGGGA